jgi:tripartite ATP-independent transporter DctM subunit
VLLGVNMQTSFMHPPFGFALFYLRSVAPDKEFIDKVTGKITKGITTGQIYWGAMPFVVIQLIMVGLVILFPQMVLHSLETTDVDIDNVRIEMPADQGTGNPSETDIEREMEQDMPTAPSDDDQGNKR